MPKYNSPDQPIQNLEESGMPDPTISIPDLDQILGRSPNVPQNTPMQPPMQPPTSPNIEIASKMGKPQQDPEAQAINLITTSITKLNQLADLLMASDEANAKSVRQMIRILGEILRSAEHGKPVALPPMV